MTTYYRRRAQGLCPSCGGSRTDEHIICGTCRARHNGDSPPTPPPITDKWFLGLHEWMIRQAKIVPPEYQI